MTFSMCPLDRMNRHEAVAATMDDVRALRTAVLPKKGAERGPGFSDGLLFHATNSELCSTVSLAWCIDQYDPELYAEQERFKSAYTDFRKVISEISNVKLRCSVELPEDYVRSLEDNFFLSYAQPREGGRPIDWRKDEFYIRLLTLYKLFSGQRPAGTEGGPCVRFMRAVVEILRRQLDMVADHSTKEFAQVDALWRLPRNDTFLKEWFRTKGGTADIQRQVDDYVGLCVGAYKKGIASRPGRDNVVYASFGGETSGADQGL